MRITKTSIDIQRENKMQKIFTRLVVASALAIGLVSTANAAVFDISLSAGENTGSGTITIADALIGPNAVVYTRDASVSINFAGFSYSIPFSPQTETFVFDFLGLNIVKAQDNSGSFVDFGQSGGSANYIEFLNGPVPGNFTTLGRPGGDVTGTFSIAPASAVPEPTTVALLGLGLFGFVASRRKSANSKNAEASPTASLRPAECGFSAPIPVVFPRLAHGNYN